MQAAPPVAREEGWRRVLRKYGPAAALVAFLALNFSPHMHHQELNPDKHRDKAELIEAKDRKAAARARLGALLWAVRSSTLRNMLLVSGAVTWAARRLFGFRANRTFPAFLMTIWALIYKWRVVESPKIFFRRTYWNTHVVEKAKLAQTEFWPVFWAFNRHAQTVTCFAISALEWLWARPILYEREVIPCHDEPNEQFIDWAYYKTEVNTSLPGHGEPAEPVHDFEDRSAGHWETPIIICIHGLGDHRDIPYLKRFARMAMRNGWRIAVWSWWKFDLADSRDLKLVIDHIHQKYPRAPLVGVAWSAGVYSLVQYLQKAGSDTPLVCAVCQSGCLDFVQAVTDVTTNENKTYPLFLLGQAHVCIRRHVRNDRRIVDKTAFDNLILEEMDPMKLFNKFYTMLPEPIPDESGGYGRDGFVTNEGSIAERVRNAAHYSAKVIDHMDKIKVTTLLTHSEDDPIVASEHVDWGKIENNRHIIVAHTHRGGHCAWHEGLFPFGDTWGDRVSCNFVSTVLESHSQTHFIVELVRQAMNSAQFFPPNSQQRGLAGRQQQQHQPKGISSLSPQTMARICSASDLASMAAPAPLAMEKGDTTHFLRNGRVTPPTAPMYARK